MNILKNMSQKTPEDKLNDVIDNILEGEALEEAFCTVIKHEEDTLTWKKLYCVESMKQAWQNIQLENVESSLRAYIYRVYSECNVNHVDLLMELLEAMVENNVLPPKPICEALLHYEKLSYKEANQWVKTFQLIRKVVGGVDYKGCRDLLRIILEKSLNIPALENVYCLRQIEALDNVIKYILDRNACLLPSYLAVNETTKICPEGKTWPHWKMGKVLSDFVDSFRPAAQMVTISGRSSLLPVVGHSLPTSNVWRLNPTTLHFPLHGPLPYDKALHQPHTALLKYVLEQPYSRDMVCNMLALNKQFKQRCEVLEEHLVNLVVFAMERSEYKDTGDEGHSQLLWQHLSSQLIYFVLFQFASFPHMVMSLYEKLKDRNLNKGRDHLMWVLLQFISGSIQKNPLAEFLPVMKLYDLLYKDSEVIPMPDVSKAQSTHTVASTCIWIHINKKAQGDKEQLRRPIPQALQQHLEFLKQSLNQKNLAYFKDDYRVALLCNAYSTNNEYFSLPMSILVEAVYGNNKNTTLLPGNVVASAPTQPFPMSFLDSLTVHAKMSLIHGIVARVVRLAQSKSNIALAPALVETYSRLLVYMEIESLGIKGFISQLLPTVVTSQAWGILHTLLEMFSYRLHHTQPHYRIQLLGHLHKLASIPQTNQNQLHLCIESTALRLIIGLGSAEVQPQLSRLNEPKTSGFLSGDSEELNRALVLTLARATHITGAETFSANWFKDILTAIMQSTPHGWSSHTLMSFPQSLAEFFQKNPVVKEDKAVLKRNVDTEYKKWKSMANENDIIAHFSMQGTPPLFLSIIWKNVMEENRIPHTAYKVLDRLGPRALSAHLRTFSDYLVYEFAIYGSSPNVNKMKCVEALNDMIWKYNIVTIDRVVLCLALRNLEDNQAQICFFIIQCLLMRSNEFKCRIADFVRENNPEHWVINNWHEKHMNFHRKYQEKFYYEGIQDPNTCTPIQHQYLPMYFGNLCLRFIPVMDILIHRLLEIPNSKFHFVENTLDHVGGLYKFHDRPITYLYNTLHYYEKKLVGRPILKRKLVQSIIGALKDTSRPPNWCLSEDYIKYTQSPPDNISWIPEMDYYVALVGRLVDSMAGKSTCPFPNCDWRFNEFPNPAAHALYASCVELMALPTAGQIVGAALLDIILKNSSQLPRDNVMSWMNAVGLILTALPDTYWLILNDRIVEMIQSPVLNTANPFQLFNFDLAQSMFAEQHVSYLIALCHTVWHHAGIGQLSLLPQFLREKLKPVIVTEEQYLFLCHLVGPFLQRFHTERTRCLLDLTVELYEIFVNVDNSCKDLHYMDPITDFLYHIKYMFVGDGVKTEVEKLIRNLRPAMQLRLRFISHINVDEAGTPMNTS